MRFANSGKASILTDSSIVFCDKSKILNGGVPPPVEPIVRVLRLLFCERSKPVSKSLSSNKKIFE